MLFPIINGTADHCTLEMLIEDYKEGLIHIAQDGHLTVWGWENETIINNSR